MPDEKISETPSSGSLVGPELVPLVQGGVTKHALLSAVVALSGDATAVAAALAAHEADTTAVHGIPDTSKLIASDDHSVSNIVVMDKADYLAIAPGTTGWLYLTNPEA